MSNPIDREALAQRLAGALLHPNICPLDVISEALTIVTGLADLLASHGDMSEFHGYTVSAEQIRSAAGAIHHQTKLIRAVVDHLEEEARRSFLSELPAVNGGAA